MRRRFVIAVELNSEGDKTFIEYLRSLKMGWWHRVPNFWLVTARDQEISVKILRDKLKTFEVPSKTALVMEIPEDIQWAGFMPDKQSDTFDWLKKTWVTE